MFGSVVRALLNGFFTLCHSPQHLGYLQIVLLVRPKLRDLSLGDIQFSDKHIYIWVNYNDLTATSLESWLVRGIIPKWP